MLIQLRIRLLRLDERFVENDLLWRYDLLRSSRFVVCQKLVVRKLENSRLPNLSVDSATVRAGLAFPRLRIDLLAYLCAPKIIDVLLAKLLQKTASLLFGEQYPCAAFADLL